MNDLLFLLPITIVGSIAAIVGLWLVWSIKRDERRAREHSTTHR